MFVVLFVLSFVPCYSSPFLLCCGWFFPVNGFVSFLNHCSARTFSCDLHVSGLGLSYCLRKKVMDKFHAGAQTMFLLSHRRVCQHSRQPSQFYKKSSRVRLKEGSSTDLCMHPEAERLDSCQLFIGRARRRVAQAPEKVSKAQEELSKFEVELASAPWPASRLQPNIKRQHQQDLRKKSPS